MTDEIVKVVYDVADIQRILNIGRSNAYAFIESVYKIQSPFRVLKIGKLYRIPKESFDSWVSNKENKN